MAKFIPLIHKDVSFELTIEVEDVSPRGHFASGDDAQDAADEAAILDRLARGDECAWCRLCVTATDVAGNTGSDSLGCVTLADDHPWGPALTAYVQDQFPDLWEGALADLNAELQRKHTPRVMRTCTTKYIGPTDSKPCGRVRARHNTTRKVATVSWDHSQDAFENHVDAAARVLGRRPEWSSSIDGGGYIFGVDPANDPE